MHVTPENKTALKIDIDKLSEEELIDLNHRIVERLRFLKQMRAHSQPVTVITENGQHWNVAPGLLRKLEPTDRTDTGNMKVVRLRKE